jgi:hypothetical protein
MTKDLTYIYPFLDMYVRHEYICNIYLKYSYRLIALIESLALKQYLQP